MIRRLAAAAIMLALAAALALLARDVWHWNRAIEDADARARVEAIAPDAWQVESTLPDGLGRRLLGIDDDLEFRSVVMSARRVAPVTASTTSRKRRAPIETALARIAYGDADRARASRAADYLGVLLYTDATVPGERENPYVNPDLQGQSASGDETPTEKALEQFTTAVTLDGRNTNAKRNLEVLLREPTVPSQQGKSRSGDSERIGSKGSGSHPPGRGY